MYFRLIKKSSSQVLATNDIAKYSSWSSVSRVIPLLPKGWYELSKFSSEERIHLVKEFWLSQLSLGVVMDNEITPIENFFNSLEDIVICAFRNDYNSIFNVKMLYLIKKSPLFFSGNPPAFVSSSSLKLQFWYDLPSSYYNFFNIHDGFSCCDDCGIISTKNLSRIYDQFHEYLAKEEFIFTYKNLHLSSFIPFYSGKIIHSYQCFFMNFFNRTEPLNVPFSENKLLLLNDLLVKSYSSFFEHNIFSSFLHWLGDYLSGRNSEII